MAKEARITFEGAGEDERMICAYPAIGRQLIVPIGLLREQYLDQGYRHGMKQRFGDLRALDKGLSEREKDQVAFDEASDLLEHLANGGDWKRSGGGGLTFELIEAVRKVAPQYTAEQLKTAAAAAPDQVSEWRKDARVKAELAKIRLKKAQEALKSADKTDLIIKL